MVSEEKNDVKPTSTLKKWQTKFRSIERGDNRKLKDIIISDAKLISAFVKKGARKTGSIAKKGAIGIKNISVKGVKGLKSKIVNRKANKKPDKRDTMIRLLTEIRDILAKQFGTASETKE